MYDRQCKIDRICDQGRCVSPSSQGLESEDLPEPKHTQWLPKFCCTPAGKLGPGNRTRQRLLLIQFTTVEFHRDYVDIEGLEPVGQGVGMGDGQDLSGFPQFEAVVAIVSGHSVLRHSV
jgi:hypothetical protein